MTEQGKAQQEEPKEQEIKELEAAAAKHGGMIPRQAIYEVMDKIDDNAIMQKIKGEIITDMIYVFEGTNGKTVVGLSKIGVDSACKELSNLGEVIREESLIFTESNDSYYFTCQASRYVIDKGGNETKLETVFGIKKQDKKKLFNKKIYDKGVLIRTEKYLDINPFAFEQGGMKAARNAKRRMINESLIKRLIEAKTKKGEVKKVKLNAEIIDADYDIVEEKLTGEQTFKQKDAPKEAAKPEAPKQEEKPAAPPAAGKPADKPKETPPATPPAKDGAPVAANGSITEGAEVNAYKKLYDLFDADYVMTVINPRYKVQRFRDIPLSELTEKKNTLLAEYAAYKAALAEARGNALPPSTVSPQQPALPAGKAEDKPADKPQDKKQDKPETKSKKSSKPKAIKEEYKFKKIEGTAKILCQKLKDNAVIKEYFLTEVEGGVICSCEGFNYCKKTPRTCRHVVLYSNWFAINSMAATAAGIKPTPPIPPPAAEGSPDPEDLPETPTPKLPSYYSNLKKNENAVVAVNAYMKDTYGINAADALRVIMIVMGYKLANEVNKFAYVGFYVDMFNKDRISKAVNQMKTGA